MKLIELMVGIGLLGMCSGIVAIVVGINLRKESPPYPVVDGVYEYHIKGGKVTNVKRNEDGTITITLEDVEMTLKVEEK